MSTTNAIPTQRIALVIQYLGTYFYGWQRQPHHRSVQEEIEKVLSTIEQRPVILHAAGRTDTGVHAAAQVAHFNTASPIPANVGQRFSTVGCQKTF